MQRLLALLLCAVCQTASADDATRHFYGHAYDLDSNRYLYTEVHEQKLVNGTWMGGSTAYFMPDGTEFGRKTYDFANDPFLPVYRLDLSKEGYAEGITDNGVAIVMSRQPVGKKAETGSAKKDGLVAADTGLPRLLAAHFDELMRGATLKFRIAAPSRLDTFKFRAKRIADSSFEDQPAVRFQVDMDSMLNMFIGPLVFTFDPEQKRLKQFSGTTNVRDPATGKDYKVRIAYYSNPPKDAGKLPPLPGSAP